MSSVTLRSLHPEDLDRVVEIDTAIAGRPRRGFFEKRLDVAQATPDKFITSAALDGDKLIGYAFARIQEGEFGGTQKVAILDVIGVDPSTQSKGTGKQLLAGLEERMGKNDISSMRTQAEWTDTGMTRFFAATDFKLEPRQILIRDCSPLQEEEEVVDGEDYIPLSRDKVLVRSFQESDIAGITRIDSKLTGEDRTKYYEGKAAELLSETGIRVSLVAESEGIVVGFIMARVDFGEFGKMEPTAAIDSLGVHPGFAGGGVGHALLSQLFANLSILNVENVRTQVSNNNFGLLEFLDVCGFESSQRLVLGKNIS
ncbi:MAG: GNAT family N-acetyltransferase [Alphaproteobacteria bacterium]|nr:GNAT family N-acetyltransferase [Rhodospirillales bacterium]MCW9046309.1 GNAT family N-acetyltransferase [Alphaproteobacteria bacterium]